MTVNLFTDTCDVKRFTTTVGVHQNKIPTEADHLTAEPCRYREVAQRGINGLTGELVVTTVYRMTFPVDADVRAGDRVTNITLDDGRVLTENFEVAGRLHKRPRLARTQTVRLNKIR